MLEFRCEGLLSPDGIKRCDRYSAAEFDMREIDAMSNQSEEAGMTELARAWKHELLELGAGFGEFDDGSVSESVGTCT